MPVNPTPLGYNYCPRCNRAYANWETVCLTCGDQIAPYLGPAHAVAPVRSAALMQSEKAGISGGSAATGPLGDRRCERCGNVIPSQERYAYCVYCANSSRTGTGESKVMNTAASGNLGGGRPCGRCGAWVPNDMVYCPYCSNGSKPDWRQAHYIPVSERNLGGCLFEARPLAAPVVMASQSGLPQKVDLRQWCSPVEDQGKTSSCTANAASGALEYLQRRAGRPVIDMSRLFIYYNSRKMVDAQNEDGGSMIHLAMASVLAFGACEETVWPFDVARLTMKPPAEAYDRAMSFEAIQYARTPLGQPALEAVAMGLPVVFGAYIPQSYFNEAEVTGLMPRAQMRMEPQGSGHAMLIVGYDMAEQTWLVRNSWGVKFGELGYFRIPFDTLQAYAHPDHFWTMGAIEDLKGFRMSGPGFQEAFKSHQASAKADVEASLAALRSTLRSEFQSNLDSAKKGFRDRLRDKD